MTAEPKWLDVDTLIRLHDLGLLRYGGPAGLRDAGLLSSALQRPQNRWAYEGVEDLDVLAATYGVAVAQNHAFIDGNKRAAFLATVLFLRRNGRTLEASNEHATAAMLKVAAGESDVEAFERWVCDHARPWRR